MFLQLAVVHGLSNNFFNLFGGVMVGLGGILKTIVAALGPRRLNVLFEIQQVFEFTFVLKKSDVFLHGSVDEFVGNSFAA
jgi:hypothetical protein